LDFFSIFYDFLKKITRFCEKITLHFSRFHSQILLNNYRFWDFSQVILHIFNLGKIRKVRKVAPFHLCKRLIFFLRKTCFFWQIDIFTKYRCFNASKWPKMPQKWIRTILFGSGYTLDTLNHGLGPFFAVFITHSGPPGAPLTPSSKCWYQS